MKIATVKLPLCPTSNQSYRTGNGRFYSSSEAKKWQDEASYVLHTQRAYVDWDEIERIKSLHKKKKFTPLQLELIFHLESLWRSDWDGRIKATQDTLFDFLGINDRLVTCGMVRKMKAIEDEYCMATVSLADCDSI